MDNFVFIFSPNALVFLSLYNKLCRNKICQRNLTRGIRLFFIGTIILSVWLDHQGEHVATNDENAGNVNDPGLILVPK